MSQDQDPLAATRTFEPVDPYNIPAQALGWQPQPEPPRGFRQRLTRLGPLRLALIGTVGVIVVGGAAWGTAAAFQAGSSGGTAASQTQTQPQAQAQPQSQAQPESQVQGREPKIARVTITQVGVGTFTGTDAKGQTLSVRYDAGTTFGTRARPLTSAQLQVGMTVTVAGARQGQSVTATAVILPVKAPKDTA